MSLSLINSKILLINKLLGPFNMEILFIMVKVGKRKMDKVIWLIQKGIEKKEGCCLETKKCFNNKQS